MTKFATAKSAGDADQRTGRVVGGFEITKIVREFIELRGVDSGECSLGANFDRAMYDAAFRGEEVQSVTVNIEPEYWHAYSEAVRNGLVEQP